MFNNINAPTRVFSIVKYSDSYEITAEIQELSLEISMSLHHIKKPPYETLKEFLQYLRQHLTYSIQPDKQQLELIIYLGEKQLDDPLLQFYCSKWIHIILTEFTLRKEFYLRKYLLQTLNYIERTESLEFLDIRIGTIPSLEEDNLHNLDTFYKSITVCIDNQTINFIGITNPIRLTNIADSSDYQNIGGFQVSITLNFTNGINSLYIQALSPKYGLLPSIGHPHLQGGSPCFGTKQIKNIITKKTIFAYSLENLYNYYINTVQISKAFALIHTWLSQMNTADVYGHGKCFIKRVDYENLNNYECEFCGSDEHNSDDCPDSYCCEFCDCSVGDDHDCPNSQYCEFCRETVDSDHDDCPNSYYCEFCDERVENDHDCPNSFYCEFCDERVENDHDCPNHKTESEPENGKEQTQVD